MELIKYFIELLKFSARPLTIIYPIPVLQFVVFSQSTHDLNLLLIAILFSFTFYPAVNLWNHVNDVKEDILGGKYNVFAEGLNVRILGVILAILLYLAALLIVLKYGNYVSLALFILCFLITWTYSDRLTLGRFLGRLKDNYVTELTSFVISYPSFTLLIWTFFEDLNVKAIALSLTVLFFVLFGVFIKDIRDVSGDEKAGLKTIGVVFSPSSLIKLAYTSIILYYSTIIVCVLIDVYDVTTIISALPIIPTLLFVKQLKEKVWKLSLETLPYFKRTLLMNFVSIALFIVSGLLSQS
ncbi:UbiA family prenyltransferase [Archaeoglobus profundus]|uniref:UbiA prenyltransferase n=1 Tax=Archaeoglobus profundus (strain DSM 5631 / JCM 9629 / NBRC 100127 / Av18) TaxID=572546 RepID=D2RHU4_ARCPA|nr:UbiA family prenyltransferase [Archaeoglobus profundus]ADB57869.1 UbiA prenyltransferase [Archaeoglobus profundus DSM 5631]